MKNITKREELWRDRQSMEELLESKLFQALHELYVSIIMCEPPLFPMDEVLVLNEVGYSVRWLNNESTFSKHVDMEQLLRNAYATMGVKYYAHIVISLTWAAVKLVTFPAIFIKPQASKDLQRMIGQCWCGSYAKKYVNKLCREGVYYMETFEDGVSLEEMNPPATYNLPGEEIRDMIAAEEIAQEAEDIAQETEDEHVPGKDRTFTLAQIVEEAKSLFPLQHSYTLVFMLQRMMKNDSTAEERELVDGIINGIIQRDTRTAHADQIIIHNEGTVNHN